MKNKIQKAIKNILKEWNIEIEIEITKTKGHADLSTNIAMKIAKELNDSPINIANKIINEIQLEEIENIEVAGPGFINFFLKNEISLNILNNIINSKYDFGKGNQNKFINVEYVSANPTGFLHIGHARSAILGSVLVDILRFAGNKVDAEYYINDAGNQMNVLGKAVRVRYLQELGIDEKMPETTYKGQDIVFVAKKFVEKYKDELKDESFDRFKTEAKDMLLEIIKKDLASYRIKMDFYSSEQEMYDKNLIKPAIKKLGNNTLEKDGALWLLTTKEGDDKDRVLIKSDGTYTYLTPDVAYHNVKLSRGYNELINIWGGDHIGYIKRMEVALKYLGLESDKLDILTVQMVKLVKDGKELKMSKRLGTSFTMQELLQEVSIDAARWFMIDRTNNSQFTFDINLANSDNSNNPVYTIQYTHARANQLINKSTKKDICGSFDKKEKELINLLNQFPDLIIKIANNHKVHLLPQYLIEVTRLFNSWYSNTKVLNSEKEVIQIMLTKSTFIVIKNGLKILGINAPLKM